MPSFAMSLRYQTKIVEAEESSKVLRYKQRDIKDNHTTGLSQIDMMNDLIKLLQVRGGQCGLYTVL